MPVVALHLLSVLTALTPAAPVPSELAALRRLYNSTAGRVDCGDLRPDASR